MRLFGLILLIVLASFGVGIGGGVPISPNTKREEANKVKTELFEHKEDKTKADQDKDLKQ